MKHIATGLAFGVALFFGLGGARAADISMKDGPTRGEVDAGDAYNWRGIYFGAQIGYGSDNHKLTDELYHSDEVLESATLDGLNSHGLLGGARVGYDFQIGRVVAGPFAEYNFTNAETKLSIGGLGSISAEKDDEWTAGLRAGVLVSPRVLVYGLVGYTQTSYSLNATGSGKLGDQDFKGIMAGAGIETALTHNVFLGLEYQHTWYDTETIFDDGRCERLKDDLSGDKIMGRISYKFGLGN